MAHQVLFCIIRNIWFKGVKMYTPKIYLLFSCEVKLLREMFKIINLEQLHSTLAITTVANFYIKLLSLVSVSRHRALNQSRD